MSIVLFGAPLMLSPVLVSAQPKNTNTQSTNTQSTNTKNTNTGGVKAPASGGIGVQGDKVVVPGQITDPFKGKSLLQVGKQIINILLGLIIMAAVVVIIVAGFRMVAGGGNPDQITKAKKTIIWAIVGLAVALMSFVIIEIIQRVVG
jgi:hypothetical protein